MERIYIIEDDENIMNLLKIALEGFGYAAEGFETAEEGLARMREEKPDLVIFDWMLPGMDGTEAIKEVRNTEQLKYVPIMLLTAKEKELDKVVGLDCGADDYMVKPFGVLELSARIRSLLRRTKREEDRDVLFYQDIQVNRKTREVVGIAFDDPAYVTWLAYNPEPETSRLRYGYYSMTTPDTLFELDMDTGERRVIKQQEVKGLDTSCYQSEHLWVTARDGVEVPVSLVYHREHFRKGSNPLLVYGYGSYGESIDADFSASRLSLLNRGFVYAIAHVRGGGELGQQWYEDGKFLCKKNTFNDYLDVCDALLAQGYGDPRLCYGMGGSAGGMLMGVAVNERPELFHGVIAQVPFVDVVTTMLDETIPLTTGEFEEWGNPQDETYYHYMKSYSPYDGVRAQAYPHMLVTTGLHDSQVQYWEPAKWVAKLRELKTDDNLLLLCTDMDSGHGGKSGRFKSYEGVALEYAFFIALAQGTLPGKAAV